MPGRSVSPVLSDEALQTLEDLYVRVRKQWEEPNSPVPITARQLEALVRLAEAAARARLSNVVNIRDAVRATHLVEGFLKRVSTADGKLDIDIVTTGVSLSQRERLDVVMDIMRARQEEKQTFTLDEVKAAAERQGIPPNRTEALFHAMRNQGEVMESRPGQWQVVRS